LAAFVNMNVLDRDFLRALAAVAIEGFQECCVCPGELVRLAKVFPPPLERLLADHGAAITLHCSVMGSNELSGHHAFQLAGRRNTD
jgi:hypothetical protein